MNYTRENLNEEIRKTKAIAKKIVNQGVIGEKHFSLESTLELHQTIKILLEELDYTLSHDIPIEWCIDKSINVRMEMESEYTKLLNETKCEKQEKEYLLFVESALQDEYGDSLVKKCTVNNLQGFSVKLDEYIIADLKETLEVFVYMIGSTRIRVETKLCQCRENAEFEKIVDALKNRVRKEQHLYEYRFNQDEKQMNIVTERTVPEKDINVCVKNMMKDFLKAFRINKTIIISMEEDDFFLLKEKEIFDHLDATYIEKSLEIFGKEIEDEFDRSRKTLIKWIQELQEIFGKVSDACEMNSFLEEELRDINELNDRNLNLHCIMIIDKLDECLEEYPHLREESEIIDLIGEMKCWID